MARLTRDTAWRSLRELLAALPKDATVEVVKTGPPPAGITLAVRVEIATAGPHSTTDQDEEPDDAEL